MPWKIIATVLFKLLDMWIEHRAKKSKQEEMELTEKQQKLHGAATNAITKAENSLNRKLDGINSLRERAEAINQFKNSDV